MNARRHAIAAAYDDALAGRMAVPARRTGAGHVFHQYVLRVKDRPAVQAHLRSEGVGTGIHYPVPVHRQRAYAERVPLGPAKCQATERAAAEVLSLPMFPELTDAQVAQVCEALRRL
jgi:dTDP-4-amino-4,6-dideoxygalactose transaminase